MNKLVANVIGVVAEKVAVANTKTEKPWTGSLPTPKELKK